MARICVIGSGYVGVVTAACLAELGHTVTCIDIDEAKVANINAGKAPIYEPQLEDLLTKNVRRGTMSASTLLESCAPEADFVFICVGTPPTKAKKLDFQYVRLAYLKLANSLAGNRPIIVNKSTLPPGTTDQFDHLLNSERSEDEKIPVVSNPEFLREGHAVSDFFHPQRIIIGSRYPEASRKVASLYESAEAPVFYTDPSTAELTKYASNAFLATKISFINEMARLCDAIDVDVDFVARGMGMDPRIGKDFLKAGVGYGGSCLPKDIAVLAELFDSTDQTASLLNAIIAINSTQPEYIVARAERETGRLDGKDVAVLGLTFKPETDDTRSSPAVEVIKSLRERNARVHVFDPMVSELPASLADLGIVLHTDPYQASAGCEAVFVATHWDMFTRLDLARLHEVMSGDLLVDGRNTIDPDAADAAGLKYIGVGRGRSNRDRREQKVSEQIRLGPMSVAG